ncbi:hypothetical protein ABH920_008355 [Catenulispora sp. EB89]|uniref:hypothetical protein n=1 Tax=Catenulispora sp. EB89 TaxID=3156257 RepID=UPI0035153123
MRNIEEALADASIRDYSGLLELDATELARYAADASNGWWKRQLCALALVGRVPEDYVGDLIARVRDFGEVNEVRAALLEALADREELLPWLRDEAGKLSQASKPSVLQARGRLGDRTAVPQLVFLAASPWAHEGRLGRAGVDALVERYGLETILADIGGQSPEARIAQVRLQAAGGLDVSYALADEDRAVAYTAQALVEDVARLRAYRDEAPTDEAKLWAAYRLYQLTEDQDEARATYEELGRPRIEVPGLDEDMRRVIVREYAGCSQRRTDPRWRIELICTEAPPERDEAAEAAELNHALAALTAAGLEPQPPVSAGQHHHQGDGTYHVVTVGSGNLAVSTLGRYATEYSGDPDPAARTALETAGFQWIDADVAAIRVTDLCVYHFGHRSDLTVAELLFYWQD